MLLLAIESAPCEVRSFVELGVEGTSRRRFCQNTQSSEDTRTCCTEPVAWHFSLVPFDMVLGTGRNTKQDSTGHIYI